MAMDTQQAYNVRDVVSHLKFSIGSGALGMDDSLRNTLTVEMSEEINQMKVLKQ
jgi:hypothetical protein